MQSLDASLRRLGTPYVDLLYLHIWEQRTPVEEVMRALDDIVRSGKALYVGISDTPAWKVAQANTLAHLRGWSPNKKGERLRGSPTSYVLHAHGACISV